MFAEIHTPILKLNNITLSSRRHYRWADLECQGGQRWIELMAPGAYACMLSSPLIIATMRNGRRVQRRVQSRERIVAGSMEILRPEDKGIASTWNQILLKF